MATFGTSDSTGTSTGGLTEIAGTKYTLSENGTITKLSVYSPTTGNAVGAIYSDIAGIPSSLIIAQNSGVAVVGGNWVDIIIPATYLLAGDYWLVFMVDQNNMRAYKGGGVNQAAYNLGTVYGTNFPTTFPAATYQNNDYIAYATYIPGTRSAPGNRFRYIIVGDGMSRSEGAT